MSLLKTYESSGSTYSIRELSTSSVESHCNRYMDSITGTVFHSSEVSALKEQMVSSVERGYAIALYEDNVEVAVLYTLPVGKLRTNIIVIQYIKFNSMIQAIMEDYLYSLDKILRFTPKDPSMKYHKHLCQPASLRMYLQSRVEFIKLLLRKHFTSQLNTLNIKEV